MLAKPVLGGEVRRIDRKKYTGKDIRIDCGELFRSLLSLCARSFAKGIVIVEVWIRRGKPKQQTPDEDGRGCAFARQQFKIMLAG